MNRFGRTAQGTHNPCEGIESFLSHYPLDIIHATRNTRGIINMANNQNPRRVLGNPNHPHYGPIRRLHVILFGLGLAEEIESFDFDGFGSTFWDEHWIRLKETYPDYSEGQLHREFLAYVFFLRGDSDQWYDSSK